MSKFSYSAKDIARILRKESSEQNILFLEGERMRILLFFAAQFIEFYIECTELANRIFDLKIGHDFTLDTDVKLEESNPSRFFRKETELCPRKKSRSAAALPKR